MAIGFALEIGKKAANDGERRLLRQRTGGSGAG